MNKKIPVGAVGMGKGKEENIMQLQERDKKIMQCCHEQGFLGTDLVEQYFFQSMDRRARERILELERAGFIQRAAAAVLKGRRIIRLTRRGHDIVRETDPFNLPMARRLDLSTLAHDHFVSSVRLRLQELWSGTWIPERALKSDEFIRIPDGVFLFPSGRKIAVELENSAKHRPRFLKLLQGWLRGDITMVLFVVTSAPLFALLKKYLADGPKDFPFALVEWEQLKAGTPKAWSIRGEINLFERSTF